MARRSGAIGGGIRGGTLLDTLIVKIDVDMSGLQRGVAAAIAEIRSLKGAIASQVGGVSLSDAMNAALVAPVVVATARLGQMRTEMRLLTNEMRNVALLTAGGAAAGGRGIVPYAGGGPLILDATRGNQARGARGRYTRGASYRSIDSDDLAGAAAGDFDGPDTYVAPPVGAPGDDDGPRRRGRRTPRWFFAYERGRRRFPGYAQAAENLGGSANGLGRAARGAMGSNLARTLGLVGLSSLLGSLIQLAANLATIISGTLAGAFAALASPLGIVVALVTALAALFVASNWDQFKEFGEWFANRWRDIVAGEGMGDIISGWNELKDAVGELWAAIREAFHDDGNSIGAVLRFFGETVIRVVNAVMELLGGLMRTLAELVRAVAALIRGDWAEAWAHFGNAVGQAFRAVLDTIGSLFPEIQSTIDGVANWVEERFRTMGEAVSNFFDNLRARNREAANDTWGGFRGNKSNRGGGKFLGAEAAGVGGFAWNPGGEIGLADNQLERLERARNLADGFGQSLLSAFDNGIASGAKFSDILKQVVADLITMFVRMTMIEPLTRQFGAGMSALFSGGGNSKGGGGGLWGMLGSLFSGFFADGGVIPAGRWGIVGERGPEIAFGGATGKTIMPMGANDNLRIDARAFIDARGADPAAISRLEAALARRDAELPQRIRAQVGDMRQRGRIP